LPQQANLDVVILNDALQDLAKLDEQQSRIVEFCFFAGLTVDDTSEALGISPSTVTREWTTARIWLHREISRRAAT
jgi:RNA polymerase sigma factor (sigma-70 family)